MIIKIRPFDMTNNLYIDQMSPAGHIYLNRQILTACCTDKDALVVGAKIANSFAEFNTIALPYSEDEPGLLNRITNAVRIISIIRRLKPRRVIFLSYDILTAPILSPFISGHHNFTFEHNTVSTCPLKLGLRRSLGMNFVSLVFSPSAELLLKKSGIKAIRVRHPIRPASNKHQSKTSSHHETPIIGCPSALGDVDSICEVANANPTIIFKVKTNRPLHFISLKNVETYEYSNEYSHMIMSFDALFIPVKHQHRASGALHDGIGHGKPVIVLRNEFGNDAKLLFPDQVFFADEVFNRDGMTALLRCKARTDVREYNISAINHIKSLINK